MAAEKLALIVLQLPTENLKSFSARVWGTAANCNITKKCPGDHRDVSYLEETCYHVVISGLADTEMNDWALTQAMLGNVDLASLINYCTAEESGKVALASTVGAVKKSTYKSGGGGKQTAGGKQVWILW